MAVTILALIGLVSQAAETPWPQFRGPTGRGHAEVKHVPLEWSADSIVWKTALPGKGQSSPVIWGDRIFLTCADEDGSKRHVLAIGKTEGKILWKRTIDCAKPENPHRMNGFATPTCATDGEHVVAFFGPGGIHAFDMDGGPQWSRELGDLPGPWGIGASPIILDGMVIQNCDAAGPSSLIALDLATGETRWQTQRADKPRGGWSTPILIDVDGKPELVLNGEFGVRSYDPADGKELWFCKSASGRGSPVPDFVDGRLHVVSGKPGETYAVKPGGRGDVTGTHKLWSTPRRAGRDLPSPAVVDGRMIVVSLSGKVTCYEAATGKVEWEDKLGVKGEFASSPLVVDGHILIQNAYAGETLVIKPGKALEIVHHNKLGAEVDEMFRAALVPAPGRIYARSLSTLYCIGAK